MNKSIADIVHEIIAKVNDNTCKIDILRGTRRAQRRQGKGTKRAETTLIFPAKIGLRQQWQTDPGCLD